MRLLLPSILLVFLSACSILYPQKVERYIVYPVQHGDTLYAISKRFDVPISVIEDVNHIRDIRALKTGSKLRIPYHGQDLSKTPQAKPVIVAKKKKEEKTSKRVQLGEAERYVGKLKWPVPSGSTKFSSKFGYRWFNFHEGIDLAGKTGTPIYAAHDGIVAYSGQGIRGYGNIVVLQGRGLITVYGHNHRNRVRRGQKVQKGARIADLGSTGKSTGPHVHFETRVQNNYGKYVAVDPMVFYR